MAEAFIGKWILDINYVKGAVEYLATVAAPANQIEDLKNTTLIEISLSDSAYEITTHIKGKEPRTDSMKLGEDVVTEAPGGITILSNTRFQNDRLTSVISAFGVEIKVERYIQDDVLVTECTSRGKTMTLNHKRI